MAFSRRSDVELIDPELVPGWVKVVNIAQYFQVAITTMLVYDTITTLDKEMKYFWKIPMTSVSLVYFMNRYVGVLGAVANILWNVYYATLPLCRFSGWTMSISSWFSMILIDYILMTRVLALYYEDKWLSFVLKTVLGLVAVLRAIAFIFADSTRGISVVQLAEKSTVCSTNTAPSLWVAALDWILPMVYGVILMSLALYKATKYWKIATSFRGLDLVKVLVQDQVVYFMLAVSCCIFNIVVFKGVVTNDFLAQVLVLLGSPSFLCILGSRMLFNLKDAGERGMNGGTTCCMPTMTRMEFA